VGNATMWGGLIIFALLLSPMPIDYTMFNTTFEKVVSGVLVLIHTIVNFLTIITGYILIKNKGA